MWKISRDSEQMEVNMSIASRFRPCDRENVLFDPELWDQ
jgi:hypothetical protein